MRLICVFYYSRMENGWDLWGLCLQTQVSLKTQSFDDVGRVNDRGLRGGGDFGQALTTWPASPQYRHRLRSLRLSYSVGVKRPRRVVGFAGKAARRFKSFR